MKKIIVGLCVFVSALVVFGDEFPAGDANGDGVPSSLDLIFLRRHILGIQFLSPEAVSRCDVNGDGKLTTLDISILRRRILGMPETGTDEVSAPLPIVPQGDIFLFPVSGSPKTVRAGKDISLFLSFDMVSGTGGSKGGFIQFAVESDTDITGVGPEMALSIGDKVILGTFVPVDNAYDHIGVVQFDLTGVVIAESKTVRAALFGEILPFASGQLKIWKESFRMVGLTSEKSVIVRGPDLLSTLEIVRK